MRCLPVILVACLHVMAGGIGTMNEIDLDPNVKSPGTIPGEVLDSTNHLINENTYY